MAISLSPISKITVELIFTVRAITCVYSDTLDWVIDFTGIARIMDPSNCIIYSRYQIVKRLCVSLLSKHTQILFWTGPTGCNLVKLEGSENDFDRPRALDPPQFLEP